MPQKYDSLELAILNLMRTNLALVTINDSKDNPTERKQEVTPENFHAVINNVVPVQPDELTLTAKMLAHEGLMRMEFDDKTGKENGFTITKEGLIALRDNQ